MKLPKFSLLLVALLCTGCASQEPVATTAEIYAMDTIMYLTAYGDQGTQAISQAESSILELENQLSRTREGSELFLLNQSGSASVSDKTAQIISAALDYGLLTGGAFSCTIAPVMDVWGFTSDTLAVPSDDDLSAAMAFLGDESVSLSPDNTVTLAPGQAIDLGGIGKGYASQVVADVFASYEIPHGMVSLGGNVYVTGGRTDGDPWRIGVQDPQNLSGYAGILTLSDGFAVTSGGYQRFFEENGTTYHHIINPATGYSATSNLLSVTIVSPDNGTLCDALSTALYVMGEETAIDFWRSGVADFEMILLTTDNRAVVSSGLHDQFTAEEGYTYDPIF